MIIIETDETVTNNVWTRTVNITWIIDSKAAIGGEMLDDRIVEAAQNTLNAQFPGINDFQVTVVDQGDLRVLSQKTWFRISLQ